MTMIASLLFTPTSLDVTYKVTLFHSVVSAEFFPQSILHDMGSKVSSHPNLRPVSLLQLRLPVYTDVSLADLGEERGT